MLARDVDNGFLCGVRDKLYRMQHFMACVAVDGFFYVVWNNKLNVVDVVTVDVFPVVVLQNLLLLVVLLHVVNCF